MEHKNILNPFALTDIRTFSYFDNTFPHIKIFAKAFANNNAFFSAEPLSVCLTGAREWSPMYPFVHSVRLIEALVEYKKNGLSFLRYLWCKNYALNNFIPDFIFDNRFKILVNEGTVKTIANFHYPTIVFIGIFIGL